MQDDGDPNFDAGAKGQAEGEKSAAEGRISNLNDELERVKGIMEKKQIEQAYDQMYIFEGLEYTAYSNWQSGIEGLKKAKEDLEEAQGELPKVQKELDAANDIINVSKTRHAFDEAKRAFDLVDSKFDAV